MSVTFPQGFRASGVVSGLKVSGNKDFALVVSDGPEYCAAGVFTPNRAVAAPVVYSRNALELSGRTCRAVAINSGSANACTGEVGLAQAQETAVKVAEALGVDDVEQVLVCSTGKIGVRLPMETIYSAIKLASSSLDASEQSGADASEAICTTDSVPKRATFQGENFRIGAMVKGAGMIAPQMATMICLITTDASIDSTDLQSCLNRATDLSLNRIDSDGCMSTNDTVLLLANGAAKFKPSNDEFLLALTQVMKDLAAQIIADAEGASHEISIRVSNASSESAGVAVAREVSRSNLLKCALFGGDPNWGRVISSIGVVPAEVAPFNMSEVDVYMNGIMVCRGGEIGDDPKNVNLNSARRIEIMIDLKAGDTEVELLTNDLTYDYVNINAEYST
ncbi:MAG: bifunctional glutamate N-acetyltransferase/amino-acid acetyltransferase ArgJ [Candidatus Ancillula sp.]|jgi:glutamate N-acetyltransferase/amino-acid N-acetyltransferase|nr:bifunctional glutamate N-acetyltransferase/amino-acid acetyltransferase ArgJ [Candidatus Ancillula sp.]